jgi:hypothetical protein
MATAGRGLSTPLMGNFLGILWGGNPDLVAYNRFLYMFVQGFLQRLEGMTLQPSPKMMESVPKVRVPESIPEKSLAN